MIVFAIVCDACKIERLPYSGSPTAALAAAEWAERPDDGFPHLCPRCAEMYGGPRPRHRWTNPGPR